MNFSSVDIEVAVYKTEHGQRSRFELGETLVAIYPAPDADKIDLNFVDGCYEIAVDFDMSRIKLFKPKWIDADSGRNFAFDWFRRIAAKSM